MPLWKNRDTDTDGAKPLFVAGDSHVDTLNVIATNEGWVHRRTYTDMHGNTRTKDEVLVAINRLAGSSLGTGVKLDEATIVDVRWSQATNLAAGGVANVIVTFNEEVTVTGSPTLAVTALATSANVMPAGTLTGTYISGSTTNRLRFNFVADANQAVYTIAAGSISLAGGTIKDTLTFTANSDLSIPANYAGANSAVGSLWSNT
tara:strand:+ start:7277 stop:7888 length:612 start_codon:yes stop_codon:yes gene_type:complete